MGYEGQYPGPIIEAQRAKPIEILWENHLPSDHIFAVDSRIHGAMPPAPSVRTVPRLHGSRTRSESDGLPEKWFPPGSSARYQYPNEQEAATLWYLNPSHLNALIDRDRTGYIPGAVKVRSHGYVGAFVKIAARRKTGGIKGYLVVLIVTWIDQDKPA
jgi:FtsP/CotA-like multicopper oxidase with cupredoxin domain